MGNPLRIGVDIDGILAEFNTAYLNKLEMVSGYRPLTWDLKNDPSCWEWPVKYGYTQAQKNQAWEMVCVDSSVAETFWGTLPVLASEKDILLLGDLHEEDDLYFITNRPLCQKQTTEMWVQEELGLILPTVLISASKGHVAKGLDLQMMFDDKPENLLDVLRLQGPRCKCYLIDRPWNKSFDHPYIIRVSDISEGMDKWNQ